MEFRLRLTVSATALRILQNKNNSDSRYVAVTVIAIDAVRVLLD